MAIAVTYLARIMRRSIQIILAPSILGLKPSGVERLGESLLAAGLVDALKTTNAVIEVPTSNEAYSFERDKRINCLNPSPIHDFSLVLLEYMSRQLKSETFPLVLGGDCSILLGIMPALKKQGQYGLVFLDAHADYYQPSQSPTGEVADMDLAIVTGHEPGILANIGGLKPYVPTKHVIHIGQRDAGEAKQYGSQDIRATLIKCFDLERIRQKGLKEVAGEVLELIEVTDLDGFWLHFDTDVISDEENPAVDYHLPGGLTFQEVEYLLSRLLATGKIAGMSVTIFNPRLDTTGEIAKKITHCLAGAFHPDSR